VTFPPVPERFSSIKINFFVTLEKSKRRNGQAPNGITSPINTFLTSTREKRSFFFLSNSTLRYGGSSHHVGASSTTPDVDPSSITDKVTQRVAMR